MATDTPTVTLGYESLPDAVKNNEMVLVDFWASWCGPCKMFAPIYEKAAAAHSDIVFGSVNTENERQLASEAKITSIPTLMAFKGGDLVFRQSGALKANALDDLITQLRDLDTSHNKADAS